MPHRLDAGIVGTRVIRFDPGSAGRLLVPVVNAADKRRDQLHPGLRASHGLAERKKQSQIGVDATALQLCCSIHSFPGRRHLDQYAVDVNALCLIELDDALGAGHGCTRVETESGIDLGRDAPRNDGQNLTTKTHQQAVHDLVERSVTVSCHDVCQQGPVLRLLHCFENQRRVGRRVLRQVGVDLPEIPRVSHHRGVLFECVQLVHGSIIRRPPRRHDQPASARPRSPAAGRRSSPAKPQRHYRARSQTCTRRNCPGRQT